MIGLIILLLTLSLLGLNYIDTKSELKFLSDDRREILKRHKKILALIFSGLIALMVCIDSLLNDSYLKDLKVGQNDILKEITLTEKEKDSITNYYTSKLEVKGEELVLAQTTIRKLLDQLDYYNKSTDEVIKKSYNLFLEGNFEEAIALLEVYVESATEKRLVRIYNLKMDLFKAQARFEEALNYSEKLFYLKPNIETKFDYAQLLFLNDNMTKSYSLFGEIHNELEIDPNFPEKLNVLKTLELFEVYYYIGRINAFFGDYGMAISSYFKADTHLKKYEGVNRNFYTLVLMNAIGIGLYNEGYYDESEKMFMDLVNNFKRFECIQESCTALKALAYMNLANSIRVGRKDYNLALKYLNFSEELYSALESKNLDIIEQISGLKFNKGMTYRDLKQYDQAEKNFKRSLDLIPAKRNYLNHNFIISEIICYLQLAHLYSLMGDKDKSLETYKVCLELIEDHLKVHSESKLIEQKFEIEKTLKDLNQS